MEHGQAHFTYRRERNMRLDYIPEMIRKHESIQNDASIMLVCINGYQENRPYG